MRLQVVLFAVALAALPGCLGTRTERVKVRRDPALIAQNERALQPLTPSEIDELFKREEERRRLSPELKRSSDHYRATRESVASVLGRVPRDPWRAEELERRRVIVRPWADVGTKRPPEPDPLPEPKGEYADEQDGEVPLPPRGEGEPEEGESEDEDAGFDE